MQTANEKQMTGRNELSDGATLSFGAESVGFEVR